MNRKNLFWAALSMAAALVMTACSSDSDVTETSDAPKTSTKSIPYTVTVNGGGTRATVDADNQTLRFAEDDKLYITGENIQGVLDLQAGDEGKASDATFSGELTYTGEGSPAANLELTATLVSAQQTVDTQVSVDDAGAVTVNYPTTTYCISINDAVQQYSNLTGTSTYGAEAFELTQQTAFLNFVITFEDGTTTGTVLSAVVKNGETTLCTANVTTMTEDEKVVAKFVLPVNAGTELSGATVKMGDKAALTISDATLAGKVYNVKKTQYKMAAAATTSDYGMVVCNNGHLHPAKTEVTGDCTAVAVFGYISGSNRYAIALQDASDATWNAITNSGSNAGTNCAVPGTWTVAKPDGANWYVATQPIYSDIFQNLGSTTSGYGGYSYDGTSNAFITEGVGGTALSSAYWTTTVYGSMFGRAFNASGLSQGGKTASYKVRPVLKF